MATIFKKQSIPLCLREYRLCCIIPGETLSDDILSYQYIFAHSAKEAVYTMRCKRPDLEVINVNLAIDL